jgi:hypothetical protein
MSIFPAAVTPLLDYLSGWPRRAAALICLIAAALSLARSLSGPPSAKLLPVVTAAHDLAADTVLSAADLTIAHWPATSVPTAASPDRASLVGRHTGQALERGSPVTDADVIEPAAAQALARGLVVTTAELATASQLAITRPGAVIDLYAADTPLVDGQAGSAAESPIARGVQVIGTAAATQEAKPTLVIATDRASAARIASRLSGAFLATLVRPA